MITEVVAESREKPAGGLQSSIIDFFDRTRKIIRIEKNWEKNVNSIRHC